jgi:hypothetical protein
MTAEPGKHLGVLVCGVVVENGVYGLAGGDLALDGAQEADELLMPVALHATADDLALQDVGSRAWICDFSSTLRMTAWAGGST